jgi:8-oxo-dGTP pyrophosphatase MutT (NUDIX family)
MSFERLGSRTLFEGRFFDVRADRVRYADGSEHERQFAVHPGAVAILPHDSEHLFMVRQPRESVGEGDLLELPAGKLDVEGESPLDCARRELREEVGMRAGEWTDLKRIYTSPGFTSEEVHLFEATDLEQVGVAPTEGERIEVVSHPIADIDAVIAACLDATSLVGLLLFRARL